MLAFLSAGAELGLVGVRAVFALGGGALIHLALVGRRTLRLEPLATELAEQPPAGARRD